MANSRQGHKPYHKYKLRTCRTMHHCQICGVPIYCGEQYYDGGYSLRAHKKCADALISHDWGKSICNGCDKLKTECVC